ncbi:MAG: hypothetical protein KF729_23440 [Sandaracinaceae bacterium]|nr:hypothetical protein [Sandaracinaceae bacterium]
MASPRYFTAAIEREGAWFVARCVEVELASQGRTRAEALDALREALELRFEGEELPELPEVERFEVAV